MSVAVDVGDCDSHSAMETAAEGWEARQLLAAGASIDCDEWLAASVLADDDVVFPVAVELADRHEQTAGPAIAEGEEAAQRSRDLQARIAVKHLHGQARAGAGCCDNVGDAVAVYITDCDSHSAAEGIGVRLQAVLQLAGPCVVKVDDGRSQCRGPSADR